MAGDYAHRDTLKRLYIDEDKTQQEIADIFDVGDSTISNWVRKHGIEKEPPWRDADTLQELYWGDELSIAGVADELDTSPDVIHRWMEHHDIKRRPGPNSKRPWHDEFTLRQLYFEDGLSQREIAEELGTYQSQISKWFQRLGIETPTFHEAGAQSRRVERGFFWTDSDGYECVGCRVDNTTEMVPVHRLVAVATYSFDRVADGVIHHRNETPWDNRPANLKVMSDSEHKHHHATSRDEQPPEGF